MNKIISKEKILYSFDIFDTLITRTTATPSGIFLVIKNKLQTEKEFINIPDFLKNNFVEIRKEAEYYTQANQLNLYNKFDCTLDDIYNLIKINYNLDNNEIELLKKLEIEAEFNNIVPIRKNIEKLKKLISEKKEVILISDMYHRENTIRKFLTNIDPIFDNIKIFTSSETTKRKSNGSLYRYIKNELHVKKQIHIGDNKFSDYIQAKWNGIEPQLYKPEQLKPYEKILLEKNSNNLYCELSTGTSRLIRENSNRNRAFNFGASFAGPILYSYVNWILEQSQKRQIKNLYFISRDGYIPKIIADILIEEKKLDINTHYFYSSRRASRFPDNKNIDIYINWIFSEFEKNLTPKFIADRFNISLDELKSFIKYKNASTILSSKDVHKIKNILTENEKFKSHIIKTNTERKELFIKYLKQEIDFSKNDFAFVDINGSGRTQDNLAHLISVFYSSPIYTFYLHLQSDMKQNDKSIKLAYINTINYISAATELLCRTTTGQTIGYTEINGIIKPILEYQNNTYIEQWGYKDYLEGISEYTKLFNEICTINNFKQNDIKLYFSYFKFLQNSLDKETADILGSIPFGIYGNEKNIKECAPKYNLFNLFSIKTSFDYISVKRTNFPLNIILQTLKKISKKTNYGYISKKKEMAYIKIFKYKFDIRNILWKQ